MPAAKVRIHALPAAVGQHGMCRAGFHWFAATLPGVEKAGLVMSDRVKQYVEDFCAATAVALAFKGS